MRLTQALVIAGATVAGAIAAACADPTAPTLRLPVPTTGLFFAAAVDGQALPLTLPLMGQPAEVVDAEIEFTALGVFFWRVRGRDPDSGAERGSRALGFWAWAADDSVVLRSSGDHPIEGFGRIRGEELIVAIERAADTDFGLPFYLGGEHTWTFVQAP